MKKLFLIPVVVLMMMFVIIGVASANGGPHGSYTATTDACAGCHRAHTAAAPRLLLRDATTLCLGCHGASGSGANTNVDDGYYLASRNDALDDDWGASNTPDNSPLLGGGFEFYDADGAGGNAPVAITSLHVTDPAAATDLAWGNGGATRGISGTLTAGVLTCSSCHDPHGNTDYRMIKTTLNGTTPTPEQVDEGLANKDYDTENWRDNMSSICAACHGTYHITRVGGGSDNTDGGLGNSDYGYDTTVSSFGHRIDVSWEGDGSLGYLIPGTTNPETVGFDDDGAGPNPAVYLPLADDTVTPIDDDILVCMTCHFPHGTAATMTGEAAGDYDPYGAIAPGPIPSGDSALLRLDNRGVCEVCHQK